MNTTVINNSVGFWGARGGVGTTTTAILFMRALLAANPDSRVTITDFAANGGFGALLGVPGHPLMHETDTSKARGKVDTVLSVCDCGVYDEHESNPSMLSKNYLVLRGPDYVGMRTVAQYQTAASEVFDGIIMIHEEGRSLDSNEVRQVTDMAVTTIPHNLAIARAADAGLLLTRPNVPSFDII